MVDWFLSPRNYCTVVGAGFLLVAAVGIALNFTVDNTNAGLLCGGDDLVCGDPAADQALLAFDWAHNVVHSVLGLLALAAAWGAGAAYARLYARVFGILYVALGGLGWWRPDVLGFLYLRLEIVENLIHVAFGAWGIAVGFVSRRARAAQEAPDLPKLE